MKICTVHAHEGGHSLGNHQSQQQVNNRSTTHLAIRNNIDAAGMGRRGPAFHGGPLSRQLTGHLQQVACLTVLIENAQIRGSVLQLQLRWEIEWISDARDGTCCCVQGVYRVCGRQGTCWSSRLARRRRDGSLGSGGAAAGSACGTMSGWWVVMSNSSARLVGHVIVASSSSLPTNDPGVDLRAVLRAELRAALLPRAPPPPPPPPPPALCCIDCFEVFFSFSLHTQDHIKSYHTSVLHHSLHVFCIVPLGCGLFAAF